MTHLSAPRSSDIGRESKSTALDEGTGAVPRECLGSPKASKWVIEKRGEGISDNTSTEQRESRAL